MIPVYSRLCYSHGRFTIDFEDLEQKAEDENNKVLILCSPHNPTGRVWSQDELRHIMDICQKHDLFIICDEIHNDILAQASAIPLWPACIRIQNASLHALPPAKPLTWQETTWPTSLYQTQISVNVGTAFITTYLTPFLWQLPPQPTRKGNRGWMS